MTGNENAKLILPDYVPEPDPARADRLIGVHYFPGWKPGTHRGWGVLDGFPERTPLLGFYDESNPEVADWEIKWALEHGITFFLYCWYRKRENEGQPVAPDGFRLGHAIHEALFHARYGDRFRFAIMWENGNGGNFASVNDLRDNLLRFWIDEYFAKPNYLCYEGRPMLFMYHLDHMVEAAGGVDGARRALDMVRKGVDGAGLGDPLILCEYRGQSGEQLERIRAVGFDAAFAYCWHSPRQYPTIDEAFAQQLDKLTAWKEAGILPFVPTATVGWDPMPWARDDGPQTWLHRDKMTRWYATPAQYRDLLARVKMFADGFPAGSLMRDMLLLDNWNEWGEGHFISPHAGGGFGYLQAVRDVFTDSRNLPDYRYPEQIDRGPYGHDGRCR